MTSDATPQRLDGTEGLTVKERRDLKEHERQIALATEKAGAKIGPHLRDIRDRRLYRETLAEVVKDSAAFHPDAHHGPGEGHHGVCP